MNCSGTRQYQSTAAFGCDGTAAHHTDESGSEGIAMRHVSTVLAVVLTIASAPQLIAQTPPEIDPAAWAKVEAQLEAEGVRPLQDPAKSAPTEVAKLLPTPDWTGEGAHFGRAVAVDGETMVVGAIDDDQGAEAGAVYVFDRDEGGVDAWGLVAKLTASDGTSEDSFGRSVSIYGETVVVGASGNDDHGSNSGSAYIFGRHQSGSDAWGQVARLTASDGASYDYFGTSVSISGDTVVVGASGNDDHGISSGSAYIFGRDQGGADAWGQVAKLTASDGASFDFFGHSVSISGGTVVVGAHQDYPPGNASGSAYIFGRDQGGADAWGQVAKLTASDGASYDEFGRSVSISGDTVVVGSPNDDDNGSSSGSAYVFGRDHGGDGAWGQVAKITASDGDSYDRFGRSVSIGGNTVVVGAYRDDDQGSNPGSAYIFGRDQGGADAWGQVAKLTASDGASDDHFGSPVSISGDTVVVGAVYDDDSGSDSGSAYVFGRDQGGADAWGQVAKQPAPLALTARGDLFGVSVAADGHTVVVGAIYDDDNGSYSGSSYVFSRDHGGADSWGQVAKLTASDGAIWDNFGRPVSISGDTVVVGAHWDDDNGTDSGSAYVFSRNHGGDDTWGHVAKLTASDGAGYDYFGSSVSISGDTVVVGALYDDDNGSNSGSAYIFSRDQGGADAWGQVAKLTASDGATYDVFGNSVSISGDTVVVGAYQDDDHGSNSGSAYIFGRDQGGADAWGQVAKLTAVDGTSDDHFGFSVSICGDTVVVGAEGDDVSGWNSGSAYVFGRDQGGADAWGQVAKLTASDGSGHDYFGYSVSISGDTAVVGAPNGDGDMSRSGSAYLFGRNQGGADAWGQVAKSTASDGASYDDFGTSVSISGCTLVAGASGKDDNGSNSGSAHVFADTAAPVNPLLSSPTHTVTQWSNDDTIDFSWGGATDDFSGVAGYSVLMDIASDTTPDGIVDVDHGTDPHLLTEGPVADGTNWYFHLRTCDAAGNCAAAEHLGPFWVDATAPSAVSNLSSASHSADTPSTDSTIDLEWTAATDNLSGVIGYAVEFSTSATWTCDQVQDTTATSMTSTALSDGPWYAHVCAADEVGNWSDVASAGPFVIDTIAPEVLAVHAEGTTADGILSEDEGVLTAVTQLAVEFSEVIEPLGGDRGIADPAPYYVLTTGPNGILDTVGCTTIPAGDDVEIAVDGAWAWSDEETVSLQIAEPTGLHAGHYGLLVCDVVDLAGNALPAPFIRRFTVNAGNLLSDPNFDQLGSGNWDTDSPNAADIRFIAQDNSTETSGMALFEPFSGAGATLELTQCLEVFEGSPYGLGGMALVTAPATDAPTLKAVVRFFYRPGCGDEIQRHERIFAVGDTGWNWGPRFVYGVRAPVGALSARVGFVVEGGTADTFSLYLDETAFFEDVLLIDGFETGDSSWWSSTPE
jgi:hypothetical protein